MCGKDSRGLEIACFVFAVSFIFAAFYYLPHAIDTGAAWILTSFLTFAYAFLLRFKRLENIGEFKTIKSVETLRVVQFFAVFFIGWATVNLILAISNEDGVEPESKWMTFIATLMGFKWSLILMRALQGLQVTETQTQSRRALLSPIGEIA